VTDTTSHWTLVQEDDAYAGRPALAIAFATVLVVGAVLVLSAWLLTGRLGSLRVHRVSPTIARPQAPREISGVEQTLIDDDNYGPRLFAQQRQELERFAWVDRSHGIVQIPITDAMRLVVERGGR
jgi:hypothetical protein